MRFLLIILLFPLKLFSQDLEGVWTGTIYNDTTRQYIPYEIAITGSKGKLSGFSHTIFTDENNRAETGVKSLKIKKKGDKLLIEDDELIYNNYTSPPPKGVRQYSVLSVTSGPSGEYLVGAFNTNRTKEYASATGSIRLQKKEKVIDSKIIPKLDELNLSRSLSFIQPKAEEKKDVAVIPTTKEDKAFAKPTQQPKDVVVNLPKIKKEPPSVVKIEKEENLIDINEDTVDYKVDVIETEDVIKEKQKKQLVKDKPVVAKKLEVAITQPEKITPEIKTPPVAQVKKDVPVTANVKKDEKKPQIPAPKEKVAESSIPPKVTNPVVNNQPVVKSKDIIIQNPIIKKPETNASVKEKQVVAAVPPKVINNAAVSKSNSNTNGPVTQPATKKVEENVLQKEKARDMVVASIPKSVQTTPPLLGPVVTAEELAKRKIETIRTVDFKSDSITLTLYDNGVIDGDSVSVILNGKTIISKKMLTANAITKTIYITPELGDSLQLIMYAENLGSIAPNTGLLIIKDGEDSYQIRFAGDLQKNSAIILRRKH